jgi:hypothetical protein
MRSALTTSELGSAIGGPEHAEAGTRARATCVAASGMGVKSDRRGAVGTSGGKSPADASLAGETPLGIWDSGVVEKPQSEKLQGLGTVRSSRVPRLARSRTGVFNRPAGLPVSVRGCEWESLLLVGKSGVPQVVAMRVVGARKGSGRATTPAPARLRQAKLRWGREVRHVAGSRIWHRSLALASVRQPHTLCRAVETQEQAWDLVFSYARRWKSEEQFRFHKTEVLLAALRLQGWEPRRTLLLLRTLAYGVLLAALPTPLLLARSHLLGRWNQRADWRKFPAKRPVYRLRWALSRLWLTHPPSCVHCRPFRALSQVTWPLCSLRWWMTLWHQFGYPF